MTDQTVPSLTDRLAAYMVEAFLDGRGYDPGDKIDVAVTLKEGFHTVLAEMREDQAAGTATYDGLLPSPPPGEPDEGATGHIAAMERVAVDALRSKRDGYRSVIQEIADTSEDAATVRFARRALGFDEGER